MMSVKATLLVGAVGLASTVAAHGHLGKLDVEGTTYDFWASGENPDQYIDWKSCSDCNPDLPVNQTLFNSPDFVCGRQYEPAPNHANVSAGSIIEPVWHEWAPNHRGCIFDYLASCGDSCENVDKTQLEWVRIGKKCLITPGVKPNEYVSEPLGYFATDEMGLSAVKTKEQSVSPPDLVTREQPRWKVKIPENIKRGKYVLRHEIMALFSGPGDTQFFPRCINLDIESDGTAFPKGVTADKLYGADEPGVTARTWEFLKNLTIPGYAPDFADADADTPLVVAVSAESEPSAFVDVAAVNSTQAATTSSQPTYSATGSATIQTTIDPAAPWTNATTKPAVSETTPIALPVSTTEVAAKPTSSGKSCRSKSKNSPSKSKHYRRHSLRARRAH